MCSFLHFFGLVFTLSLLVFWFGLVRFFGLIWFCILIPLLIVFFLVYYSLCWFGCPLCEFDWLFVLIDCFSLFGSSLWFSPYFINLFDCPSPHWFSCLIASLFEFLCLILPPSLPPYLFGSSSSSSSSSKRCSFDNLFKRGIIPKILCYASTTAGIWN